MALPPFLLLRMFICMTVMLSALTARSNLRMAPSSGSCHKADALAAGCQSARRHVSCQPADTQAGLRRAFHTARPDALASSGQARNDRHTSHDLDA